jgi:catechol 2,3-dioxygenase-like lactoylglutathione lyase family enzyme
MRITRIVPVLDAGDVAAVSAFWAGLLGGQVQVEDGWHSVVVDGELLLDVQHVPDHVPPQWPDGQPQQAHLDLYVDDIATAHRTAIALGARPLGDPAAPDGDVGFAVYADPAGHPFCFCWGSES